MPDKGRIPVGLIEPSDIVRTGMAACLNDTGIYEVVHMAEDPAAYLTLHDQRTWSVIMAHPLLVNGACGIAFLHGHLPHVRILAYSAQATPAGMQSAIRSGASGYLPLIAGFPAIRQAVDDVRIKAHHFHEPFITACLERLPDEGTGGEELKPHLLELLLLLADLEQYTDQRIADKMGIPLNTVLSHKKKLYTWFGVHTKTAAVLMGIIEGHIPLPERKAK